MKSKKEYNLKKKGDLELITRYGLVKVGKTKTGEVIVCRDFSSTFTGNRPVLEVHHDDGHFTIIRYND